MVQGFFNFFFFFFARRGLSISIRRWLLKHVNYDRFHHAFHILSTMFISLISAHSTLSEKRHRLFETWEGEAVGAVMLLEVGGGI